MADTKKATSGRPRCFDLDEAVAIAQRLFQDDGYEGVGVAHLTRAIGINPPSFYAAFGSKAELFQRVLDRYQAERLPHAAHLRPGVPPARALRAYLEAAARTYTDDAKTAGCLILETARGVGDCPNTQAARDRKETTRQAIAGFLKSTHPRQAASIADFVMVVSTGMSAEAREGVDVARLLETADLAASAIAQRLA